MSDAPIIVEVFYQDDSGRPVCDTFQLPAGSQKVLVKTTGTYGAQVWAIAQDNTQFNGVLLARQHDVLMA